MRRFLRWLYGLKQSPCVWRYEREMDYFSTGCGEGFIAKEGHPGLSLVWRFCPHCGKRIKVKEGDANEV